MKGTVIVRRLDELGRITLPIELRRSLQLQDKDAIEIAVEGDRIILTKHYEGDIFTGSEKDLIEYMGKKVSKNSIRQLAELAGFKLEEE